MLFKTHINEEYEKVSFGQLISLIRDDSTCCLAQSRNREDFGIKNTVSKNFAHFKPVGMYYSIGNEWLKFMNENRPHDMGSYLYDISFSDKDEILLLKTKEDVENFEKKFMISIPQSLNIVSGDLIDWKRVCKEYKGIEVHIVQYEGMSKWLSRWDVRQGCIWDPTCLNEDITLLAEKISDEEKDSLLEGARRLSENYIPEEDDYSDEEELPEWMLEELGLEYGDFDKFSELKNYIRKRAFDFDDPSKQSMWNWYGYKNSL